jgi:hypothetical protein
MKATYKKKGQMSLAQLPTAVIVFTVAVIVTAIMATVLANIQTTQCTTTSPYNTTSGHCDATTGVHQDTFAYNVTEQGLTATSNFATFFSPISTIVAAVVIIGLILGAFVLARGRSGGGEV